MKFFIVISAIVAVAVAKPSGVVASLGYAAAPIAVAAPVAVAAPFAVAAPISSQFHAQDALGQYSYGYSTGFSAKAETRAVDGTTVGEYTYVDPSGKLQSVEYSSDANGFRVAASNLPVAPALPKVPALPLPVPVGDTPEVIEARAKHLAAFEEVQSRATKEIASIKSAEPVVPAVPDKTDDTIATAAVAVKSAVTSSESVKSTAVPAAAENSVPTVAVKSAPAVIAKSVVTPAAVSVKSVVAPSVAINSVVTPAVAPAVAVKSFVTPTIAVGASPVLAAPTAYSYSYGINSVYGFAPAVVAQPTISAYSFPLVAQPWVGQGPSVAEGPSVEPSSSKAPVEEVKASSD